MRTSIVWGQLLHALVLSDSFRHPAPFSNSQSRTSSSFTRAEVSQNLMSSPVLSVANQQPTYKSIRRKTSTDSESVARVALSMPLGTSRHSDGSQSKPLESPTRVGRPKQRRPHRKLKWVILAVLAALTSATLWPIRSASAASTVFLTEPAVPVVAAAVPPPAVISALSSPVSKRTELQLTVRLLVAALIGAAVGKERSDAHHHSAGVRTMSLVAMGAAAFTVCSAVGFANMAQTRYDPSRMASNVASGVGFIGAGVITTTTSSNASNNSMVHGLTTAAAIWLSAAIGVACGVGLYMVSTAAGLLTIAILRFGQLTKREKWERHRRQQRQQQLKQRSEKQQQQQQPHAEQQPQGLEEKLRQRKTLQKQQWTNETDLSLGP